MWRETSGTLAVPYRLVLDELTCVDGRVLRIRNLLRVRSAGVWKSVVGAVISVKSEHHYKRTSAEKPVIMGLCFLSKTLIV